MRTITNKRKIARIEVQRSFCEACGRKIRKELQRVESISNIIFYPKEAMVIFSFSRANELSSALNILTKLGFPEIGEDVSTGYHTQGIDCNCNSVEKAA